MGYAIKRTETEINNLLNSADAWEERGGTAVHGMSFEQGVAAGIRWLVGDTDQPPDRSRSRPRRGVTMPNEAFERELLIDGAARDCVEYAHQKIWHGELTGSEARLAWLMVIDKLLQSAVIDRQAVVTREHLGLLSPPSGK